ncbi:MAG: zinc transporter ZntB [Planctomycetota bacterium]|nr:zinc transporter ZntB [Planctomycetota bacterium]
MQKDLAVQAMEATLLDGQGGGSPCSSQELASWAPEKGPLWVHLTAGDPAIESWLRDWSRLQDAECDGLMAAETRPRCTVFDEGLLITLRGVNLNPGEDPEDMVAIRIWLDEHRMISVSRRRLMAVGDMEDAIGKGVGPMSSPELLTTLAGNMLQRMVPTLEDLSDAVDQVEESAVTDSSSGLQKSLAEFRRQVISLRRHLAPQREAMAQIAHNKSRVLNESDRRAMQWLADHVTRHVEELDELRERTVVTHDLLLSRQSDQMNQRMLTLSIVTAIFLPLGLLTGLLGINVGGIPGASYEWAFAAVCVLLVVLVGLQLWIMRRMKWF